MKDLATPASGAVIGVAGMRYAELLPTLLQYANLTLAVVSVVVAVLTIIEKTRRIRVDAARERDEEISRNVQRKLLRRMGMDDNGDTV